MSSMKLFGLPMIGSVSLAIFRVGLGQQQTMLAPSPAPTGPSNDEMAIDQGVGYLLMLVALAITYFIH